MDENKPTQPTKYRAEVKAITFEGKKHDLSCENHHHKTPQKAAACGDGRLRAVMANAGDGSSLWMELRKITLANEFNEKGEENWIRYSMKDAFMQSHEVL